ncbi:hypothetical protein GCM10011581_44890 [Saccharopolyspora subtropica]|uniref:Uncharacterized protein n=1 Tax=Saccharopolyspora thermophila TaxID=89367 RepID=A0A917NIB4_9PSEU|nr:hypothetical protein [Saccharopolyspora subtropica]GGJ02839.1 hypothetical protein GCM10011581_44890 [Saccharopolyspora subtropica]
MTTEPGESGDGESTPAGPNAVCHTCGGMQRISTPRLYVVQATNELTTGMTMAEGRTCPQCKGRGSLSGLQPPG